MEKSNQIKNGQNVNRDEDAIMNRVNQAYDKIAQDVKNMINESNQENTLQ